jgi:hypothetical protein
MKRSIVRACGVAVVLATALAANAVAKQHDYPPGCLKGGLPRANLLVANKTSHLVYINIENADVGSVPPNSTRTWTYSLHPGRNTIRYGAQRGTNRHFYLLVTNNGSATCRTTRTINYTDEDQDRRERINLPHMRGAAVDWCASWATNCGKGGADQFCQLKGFAGASDWTMYRPGKTWVIGSNRHCTGPNCQGFRYVTCRGEQRAPRTRPRRD